MELCEDVEKLSVGSRINSQNYPQNSVRMTCVTPGVATVISPFLPNDSRFFKNLYISI